MQGRNEILALIERRGQVNEAKHFYEGLKAAILQASQALTDNQRLVVSLQTAHGDTILVNRLGYTNPNLLHVYGKDMQNADTTVLAHPCTVQLIVKRLAPATAAPARRPIGFLDEIPVTGQPESPTSPTLEQAPQQTDQGES